MASRPVTVTAPAVTFGTQAEQTVYESQRIGLRQTVRLYAAARGGAAILNLGAQRFALACRESNELTGLFSRAG